MAYLASFLYQTIWRCQKEEVGNKAFQNRDHLQEGAAELRVRQEGWVVGGWVGAMGSQGQVLSPDSLSGLTPR